MTNREKSLGLLAEYVTSESLKRHCLAVGTAMRWHAELLGLSQEEQESWAICGLLHDFDYERFPDPAKGGHPFSGTPILRELGYSEEIIQAILGHATFSGVTRDSQMSKYLFAVDELSGFCVACVFVRPDKSVMSLETKSVLKKLKTKEFAKGCSREDILLGVQEIGLTLEEHVTNVIKSLQSNAKELGIG